MRLINSTMSNRYCTFFIGFYKIKVTNNEERIGSGFITFYVPEGYHILNTDWTITGNEAKYKVEDLNIGETREYEIILEKNSSANFQILYTSSNLEEAFHSGELNINLKENADVLQFRI